jgi:GTP cyclohydrolase I
MNPEWRQRRITDAYRTILASTEPGIVREGTVDSAERAARAWIEKTSGYTDNDKIVEMMRTFEVESTVRGMIIIRDIEVESMCEHHFERVWGVAHIGYIPRGRVLGLSKFSRVVDVLSRRLQVQERLTASIADTIESHLQPLGVGVVLVARHACMEARGIRRRGQTTLTHELRGVMMTDASARSEFLARAHADGLVL